ncbi:Cell surface antigen I/II [Frankliniella fusca]|uniref:Cell surface antigen I/II n=1 Tax=Frankliniella fusca TaxID=407009 RepID=A0AAE1LA23_9NEOP|nr:Cell surface antigen I/II [Frankliniella fusca]
MRDGGVVELVASEPSDQASVHGPETPSPAQPSTTRLGSAIVRPRAGRAAQPVPVPSLARPGTGSTRPRPGHRCENTGTPVFHVHVQN